MAFETKEQVLEKIISGKKPNCPHCGERMNIWEVPPISMGDGLGWGTPYLFICFNDDCPIYAKGWGNIEKKYGHRSSVRCLCYPGTETFECLPVFSEFGATGQVVDEQVVAQQERAKEDIKKGFSRLAEIYAAKDGTAALEILLDAAQQMRVRIKAAEIVGDIGQLDAIEPISNLNFSNELLEKEVKQAIKKIHTRFFTRECPFCAEVIKQRARVCKHCGKDVAGE